MVRCKYEGTGVWAGRCRGTREVEPCPGYEKCKQYKPEYMTNADRIRAMSDGELAVGIKKIFIGKSPWCDHHCKYDDENNCNNCLLEWLKQPAEVDDG